MSFHEMDQVTLKGLGGHTKAGRFNGLRGVVLKTKAEYRMRSMHTVLVLPPSGKAQLLTLKAKYLAHYRPADDESIILEDGAFGMPRTPPELTLPGMPLDDPPPLDVMPLPTATDPIPMPRVPLEFPPSRPTATPKTMNRSWNMPGLKAAQAIASDVRRDVGSRLPTLPRPTMRDVRGVASDIAAGTRDAVASAVRVPYNAVDEWLKDQESAGIQRMHLMGQGHDRRGRQAAATTMAQASGRNREYLYAERDLDRRNPHRTRTAAYIPLEGFGPAHGYAP